MTAEARRLGPHGPGVSPIALGCMGMSDFYGPADRAEAFRTLRRAVELGVTLFDTADMYGLGANERLLAAGLGADRARVIVATKFGIVRDSDGGFLGVDGSPTYVRRACEASLARLNVDRLDLFQLHRVDPATPIEETVAAMAELVREGKVASLGLSEVTVDELRRACAAAPIATVQSEYSVLERTVESGVLGECAARGITLLAFAPLMRGLVARRFTTPDELDSADGRRIGNYPRLAGDALRANLELARTVWEIADTRGVSPAQVALAWTLAQGSHVVPLAGARTVSHLEDNLRAAELKLTSADLSRLDAVVGPGGAARGERLPNRAHNRGAPAASLPS